MNSLFNDPEIKTIVVGNVFMYFVISLFSIIAFPDAALTVIGIATIIYPLVIGITVGHEKGWFKVMYQ